MKGSCDEVLGVVTGRGVLRMDDASFLELREGRPVETKE
jgi:hypothetical protein